MNEDEKRIGFDDAAPFSLVCLFAGAFVCPIYTETDTGVEKLELACVLYARNSFS